MIRFSLACPFVNRWMFETGQECSETDDWIVRPGRRPGQVVQRGRPRSSGTQLASMIFRRAWHFPICDGA
ncbi:hypothetical protein NXC24_PB00220 (plasmid) [Rhizobium sp. NXC24]|nr:hypothetical protein NXC24_PB00220 [Rhizobium sp. NXC24]